MNESRIKVQIDETLLQGCNQHAKERLTTAIQTFAEDLIREANRLESAASSTKGVPEVTSTHVSHAEGMLRHGFTRKTRTSTKILRSINVLAAMVTGGLFQFERFQKDPAFLVLFLAFLIGTVITTTVSIFKED